MRSFPNLRAGLVLLTLSAFYFPAFAACLTAPAGLIGWWSAEGNGADRRAFLTGTLNGGIGFSTGEVGQAFSLDGVDDHVSIPDSAVLSPHVGANGQITVEAWVKA